MRRHVLWASLGIGLASPCLYAQVPGPNINVISGVEDQFRGDLFLQRQNEPTIAVSLRNPRHLLAAANDYRPVDWVGDVDSETTPSAAEAWIGVYRSYDGGRTWFGGMFPGFPGDTSPAGNTSPLRPLQAGADPVMVAGTGGHFYLGGLAFTRGGTSKLFVGRFVDHNDGEAKDSILYEFTTVVDQGQNASHGLFMDKPSIAYDIPRTPGSTADSPGSVYIAYSRFEGQEAGGRFRTGIYFARSTDGGVTFSTPIKISNPYNRGQGTAIAIDPADGTIYVVWREFADQNSGNFMLMAKSTNGGQRFGKPAEITRGELIEAYDQWTLSPQDNYPSTARSNAYPTIAVDHQGRVYVAWQERIGDDGFPGIVLTTSTNGGKTWIPRTAVEYPSSGQMMPTLSFGGGLLRLLFYDYRNDVAGLDTATGFLSGIDRRADVRVAQSDLTAITAEGNPVFDASVQVSRYLTAAGTSPPQILETAPGYPALSRPNLPLYRGGTTPFFGDYISMVPAVQFVRNTSGLPWRWATEPTDVAARTTYAVWTDHRDVLPPVNGDWTTYDPPNCINAGSRNSNIYFSEISDGVVVGSPQTSLRLVDGSMSPYIISVANRNAPADGAYSHFFRLTLFSGDSNLRLSFVQVTLPWQDHVQRMRDSVDVEILAYSTLTYPVFAYCDGCAPNSTFSFEVDEIIQDADGNYMIKDGGIETTLDLNVDPTNPLVSSPQVSSPQVSSPQVSSPQVSSPQVSSPQISSPQISSPQISSTGLGDVTDYTWTLTNTSTSEAPFSALTNIQNLEGLLAAGYEFQVIVYQTVASPVWYVPDSTQCPTEELLLDEVISSIYVTQQTFSSPQVSNPQVSNPQVSSPQISSPQVSNATFSMPPTGETLGYDGTTKAARRTEPVKVTLRVFPPTANSTALRAEGSPESSASFFNIKRANQTIVSQVADDNGQYAYDASLAITTVALEDGTVGVPYNVQLQAIGGKPKANPNLVWTITAGSLPPGLALSPNGVISGTPTQLCDFDFTVQVEDASGQSYERDFILTIVGKAPTVTTLTLPSGPSTYGDTVTLSAGVTATLCGTTTAVTEGTVNFYDGNTLLGSGTLNSGQWVFSTCTLSGGDHSLTARFVTTDLYEGSTSTPATHTVTPAGTKTGLTSSLNPSIRGQTVTFTATVSPDPPTACAGTAKPGGTVQFPDGAQPLDGPVALDVDGQASFTTSTLAVGNRQIQATYSGDNNYRNSSVTTTQSVIFTFEGFSSPLGPIDSNKAFFGPFKAGSSVPVKWRLFDINGPVSDIPGTFDSLILVRKQDGAQIPARGSPELHGSGQYVFNWDTSGLSEGDYDLVLNLKDQVTGRKVTVRLKR